MTPLQHANSLNWSDNGSLWNNGYPAVLFIEDDSLVMYNRNWHTTGDTVPTFNWSLLLGDDQEPRRSGRARGRHHHGECYPDSVTLGLVGTVMVAAEPGPHGVGAVGVRPDISRTPLARLDNVPPLTCSNTSLASTIEGLPGQF